MNPFMNPFLYLRAAPRRAQVDSAPRQAELQTSVSMAELGQALRDLAEERQRSRGREASPD